MLWFENIEPPFSLCTSTGGWRVEGANATGLQLVVLIPGLWLLPSGWAELDSRQITVSETDLLWALALGC